MILGSSDHISKVAFVVFLLSQRLDRRHQDIVVAEEVFKNESREWISKALVGGGIENLNLNWDVQPLPGGWPKSEEADLKAVLYNVLVLRPDQLPKSLQFTHFSAQRLHLRLAGRLRLQLLSHVDDQGLDLAGLGPGVHQPRGLCLVALLQKFLHARQSLFHLIESR